MIKKVIVILLSLLFITDNSFAVENGKIEKSSSNVVALYTYDRLSCSGFLYSNRIVLTAAHCVSELDHPITSVALVNHTASIRAEKFDVEQILTLNYSLQNFSQNDFSVIILSKPMPQPVLSTLLTEDIKQQIINSNSFVKVEGYGEQDTNGTNTQTVRDPAYFYAHLDNIQNEIQLSNGPVGNVCAGDSGGPNTIFYDNKEIYLGATSHGYNQPNCGRWNGGGARILLFDPVYKYIGLINKAEEIIESQKPKEQPKPIVVVEYKDNVSYKISKIIEPIMQQANIKKKCIVSKTSKCKK